MLSAFRSLGGERRLMPFGRDETDDRGQFRIFGIPPGSYLLGASPRPFAGLRGAAERPFPPTYYPGVLRVEEAATVQVAAGAEVAGFHITLIETRTYNVGGRVLTPEGKPAHSAWIMSLNESGEDIMSMMGRNTATNLQGEFKVSGLLSGRHRLYARSAGGEDLQTASATVDVADQDLSGITLVLGKGAQITGRIVVEGEDSAVDWRRTSLSMVSVSKISQMSFGGTGARVEEDFTFKISNLPEGPIASPSGSHRGITMSSLSESRVRTLRIVR